MKVKPLGTDAVGLVITGNPKNCEPIHVRIVFPGGEVEVTRATDGEGADYWVHVNVHHNSRDAVQSGEEKESHVSDARIDHVDGLKECAALDNENLYHLALRVTRGAKQQSNGNDHQQPAKRKRLGR